MFVRWIFCLLLVGLCSDGHSFEWNKAILSIKKKPLRRQLFHFIPIIPGTKWCGSGNVATNNADLGSHSLPDSCCRAHDKCPDVLRAGQSRHSLTNHATYARLNCECDNQFLVCLRNSTEDKLSRVVGTLYFDLLRQKCFKLEHEINGCENYNWEAKRCRKYWFDLDSQKTWQWFDVPTFEGRETI